MTAPVRALLGEDRQNLPAPAGVEVTWLARDGVPGRKALAAVLDLPLPDEPCYAWTVGESSLPVALRRHWVRAGMPKENIMVCGYRRSPSALSPGH
jgi:NADPH-dependent ferric siderophore reductase